MIRINLLPVKELVAAVQRRREMTIGVVVLSLAALLLIAAYLQQTWQISALSSELTTLRSDIQLINAKVKQVGDLQNKIKELNNKYGVIADLTKKKSGPVGVMESLSSATPSRLWLTEFKETAGKLTINGLAVDNQTVADFLKALAATAYYRDVELVETTQVAQDPGPFKKFSIRTTLDYLPRGETGKPKSDRAPVTKEGKQG